MQKAATLSPKNQVIIPREVRAALGLKAGETVVFQLEDDGRGPVVTLRRARSLQQLAGSVPTPADVVGLSWEEIRSRAWSAPVGRAGTPPSADGLGDAQQQPPDELPAGK
jgi:AbrB family looped-hinge helix DNA binding protein